MRRIIVVLTLDAVIVTIAIMISTFGASASAQQSLCPPTGPSGGPATLVNSDEPHGAGFVCLNRHKSFSARLKISYSYFVTLGLILVS